MTPTRKTPPAEDWKRMRFKNNKVWVAVDENRQPLVRDKKVRIKYQLDQDYTYRVFQAGVTPIDGQPEYPKSDRLSGRRTSQPRSKRPMRQGAIPKNAIRVYTDGASSGNPGPAGIGVYLQHGSMEKRISRHIGRATNNVAELEAIRAGLQAIKNAKLPVRVFTDSSYALGVLSLGWKARRNRVLIREIQTSMERFADLRLIKVKGHSGNEGNEIANQLATASTNPGA